MTASTGKTNSFLGPAFQARETTFASPNPQRQSIATSPRCGRHRRLTNLSMSFHDTFVAEFLRRQILELMPPIGRERGKRRLIGQSTVRPWALSFAALAVSQLACGQVHPELMADL
jgi:hypothetical protein